MPNSPRARVYPRQRCLGYTLALGEFGNDGVYRFEGGDGGPLAAAVDVEVVIGVFQVVYRGVFRRESVITQLEEDAFALTDGCSRCHRHSKNEEVDPKVAHDACRLPTVLLTPIV